MRVLDPDFVDVGVFLAYAMQGRFEEAYRAGIAYLEAGGAPFDWMREAVERGWAEGGWEGAARAWIRSAMKIEGISPQNIAQFYTLIGERDEAFVWLERGYRERDPLIVELRAHPGFDPLRSDPRFDDLLRRIGFPEE